MESLTLRYELTPEEVAAALADTPAGRARARQARRLGLGLGAAILALSLATGMSIIAAVPPAVLVAIFLVWASGRRARIKSALPMVRATPSLTQPVSLTIEGDGIRVQGPTEDSWSSWRHWESVTSTSNGVALVLRGGWGVQFIPTRAFAPDGQQADWTAFVSRCLGPQPASP